MSDAVESLLGDMVEWIARDQRSYAEAMDAWRTSCPRLQVWEEASERGYVARTVLADGRAGLCVTKAGQAFLGGRAS